MADYGPAYDAIEYQLVLLHQKAMSGVPHDVKMATIAQMDLLKKQQARAKEDYLASKYSPPPSPPSSKTGAKTESEFDKAVDTDAAIGAGTEAAIAAMTPSHDVDAPLSPSFDYTNKGSGFLAPSVSAPDPKPTEPTPTPGDPTQPAGPVLLTPGARKTPIQYPRSRGGGSGAGGRPAQYGGYNDPMKRRRGGPMSFGSSAAFGRPGRALSAPVRQPRRSY